MEKVYIMTWTNFDDYAYEILKTTKDIKKICEELLKQLHNDTYYDKDLCFKTKHGTYTSNEIEQLCNDIEENFDVLNEYVIIYNDIEDLKNDYDNGTEYHIELKESV